MYVFLKNSSSVERGGREKRELHGMRVLFIGGMNLEKDCSYLTAWTEISLGDGSNEVCVVDGSYPIEQLTEKDGERNLNQSILTNLEK